MRTLLSIDWDFFWKIRPGFYEESSTSLWHAWRRRKPQEQYSFRQGFWKALRKRFVLPRTLTLAESHCEAYRAFLSDGEPLFIINFDSHHDAGYPDENFRSWAEEEREVAAGTVECGNWIFALAKRGPVSVEWVHPYPDFTLERHAGMDACQSFKATYWKDWLEADYTRVRAQQLFIARSGSWVHPQGDQNFNLFLKESSTKIHEAGTVPVRERRTDYEHVWWVLEPTADVGS